MTSKNTTPSQSQATLRVCPICKRQVLETEATFPFCSKRCKLIDLARWAQGDYKISRPVDESDLDET